MAVGPASIVLFLSAVTAVLATLTNGNGQTWAGCSFQLPANTVRIGSVSSGEVCATVCQAQSPPYQYAFASALTTTTVTCFCGNTGIGVGFYVPYNEATCYSLDFISQYVTSTSFAFQSCAGGTSSSPPTHQPDVPSCFVACAPSSLIMYLGNTGDCFCPFTEQMTYPDCYNTGYAFSHPGGSAIPRRRRRDQLALGRLAATQLCAAGLSACRLRADSDGYECLDTQSELESCGGCLWGEVIPELRPTTDSDVRLHANTTLVSRSGIDCTSLQVEGAAFKGEGVTCYRGQ